jgi:chemotaxis protein MotB
MRRWSTRCLHLPRRVALPLVLVPLLAISCVSRGVHEEVVGALETKNADLEQRVKDLERSNAALGEERVALLDEMEDLRQARDGLERDVAKLQRSKDLLTSHLREREAQVAQLSRVSSTYKSLVTDLESEVAAGQIQIEQLRDGIRLNLPQDILFPSGSATLQASGAAVLRKVADRLKDKPHRIEVRGHSDNVPLSPALVRRYGSNWELAAARASSVVRLLADQGIDPTRLTVLSFGEYAPVASNDTPEGRARNRRIDIRLIPPHGGEREDATEATPSES